MLMVMEQLIRVFDVNSPSKIKNSNFNAGLKNMTKLVRIDTGWQWSSLGIPNDRLLHLKLMDMY